MNPQPCLPKLEGRCALAALPTHLPSYELHLTVYPLERMSERISQADLPTPYLLHRGAALSLGEALERLGAHGFHGAQDRSEGLVYRLERAGEAPFVAKYVRPDKIDGLYLEDHSSLPAVLNTWPQARWGGMR